MEETKVPNQKEDDSTVQPQAEVLQEQEMKIVPDYISEEVYQNLPQLLKETAEIFKNQRERDVYLTGALCAFGSLFYNVAVYNEVDKIKYSPNLIAFIVAPPASGKGALKYAKAILSSVDEDFISTKTTFILPGNTSAAGILKLLNQNEGCGIVIESEIDTLANANKQDWGNFTDVIRNTFENDSYKCYRKGGQGEFTNIERVKFSLVLSGTPDQFKKLITSVENGLFSRGCYYVFNDVQEFKCFGRTSGEFDLEKKFAEVAEVAGEYFKQINLLKGIDVTFNEEQLSKIQNGLNDEFNSLIYNSELSANVKRAFIIVQKIASILTVLDYKVEDLQAKLSCSEISLDNALNIVKTYLYHSIKAVALIPKVESVKINPSQLRLLQHLPDDFERAHAQAVAQRLGIQVRTCDDIIKQLCDKQFLEKIKNGHYKKIRN